MSASRSTISSERKGYGRGLILGLTMAETFLLLVFCLLLVAAAALTAQRQRAEKAEMAIRADLANANEALSAASEQLKRLEQANSELLVDKRKLEETIASIPPEVLAQNAIDDDWQELVLAKDLTVAVAAAGLTLSEAMKLVPALQILKEHGLLDAPVPEEALDAALGAGAKAEQPHEWPPNLNLSEAGGYYFAVGSADLTDEFRRRLREDVVVRIAEFLTQYNVDVVEVIGHTDEQNLAEGRPSNLDRTIGSILGGQATASDITPADNAGLGLARAIAVAQLLRNDPRLEKATVLPLSGAQLILPGDLLTDGQQAGDVRERRRIEIRIRQRSDPLGE